MCNNDSSKPYGFSLPMRMSWGNLSKALEMSVRKEPNYFS